jgi:hypothetical protein
MYVVGNVEAEGRVRTWCCVLGEFGSGLRREMGLEAASRRTRSVALVGGFVGSAKDRKELS